MLFLLVINIYKLLTYVLIVTVAEIQLQASNPISSPPDFQREAQFGDSGLRNILPGVKAGRRIFL